jgi:hypothetical protein
MNAKELRINRNRCFWKYKEVLELNQHTVQPGARFVITGNRLTLAESVDTRRKNISVFNTVERLNKNPSLFINYLRVLAEGKGMGFVIDQAIAPRAEAEAEGEGETRAKDARTNYKLQSILHAKDLTASEYDELSTKKKMGKTTTEENFQVERCFWQRYLVQKEIDPDLLLEFIYDNNPLDNFVGLIDIRNHTKEDNLRSAKFVERVAVVKKLLEGLGFDGVMDRERKDRKTFMENWAKVVEEPEFQSKRLNELWGLGKTRRMDKDMTPRQVLPWVNFLIKPFGLCIKGDHSKYRLAERFDILGLIKRKNERGRFFVDGRDLLKQVQDDDDLFIDEETGEVRSRTRQIVDTTLLDVGVFDDE